MKKVLCTLLRQAAKNTPFHQSRAPRQVADLAAWPLMDKYDLLRHSPDRGVELLDRTITVGRIVVASGGTTSSPKFIFYTEAEVETLSQNLAEHLLANGVASGDRILNYTPIGGLYGTFIMVNRAFMLLPILNIPMGIAGHHDHAIMAIQRFRANAILGMPTSLLDLARHMVEKGVTTSIDKVFYAGEMMYPAGAELLRKAWTCQAIRSAGYATNDVGTVGWQCLHCNQGEHFPFRNVVVEIIDDEIVVTPLYRRLMPIIRYRTGDRGQWVKPSCGCGNGLPLFKLLGRADDVILIWGCSLVHDNLILPLVDCDLDTTAVQIEVRSASDQELLTVRFECASLATLPDNLMARLRDEAHHRNPELQDLVPRQLLDVRLFFEPVRPGTLKRNERTGKVVPFLDLRASA
ncbi:MAG: hypothetical protein WCT10_04470 [Patescibacteria group bacterium]